MKKRGQTAIFMIIAIIIILTAGFYYLIRSNSSSAPLIPSIDEKLSLETEYNTLHTHVESCLIESTKSAIEANGLKWSSEQEIKDYVEGVMPSCVDFPYFENKGFVVDRNSPAASVTISEDSVLVQLNYTIVIRSRNESASADRFEYMLRREKAISFEGVASKADSRLMTEDGTAELVIPKGTKATDGFGKTLSGPISIKLLDRNFEGLDNGIVIGMAAYELMPDGARFDGPLTLKIRYFPDLIPPDIDLEKLRIAWYDPASDIWRAVPTTLDKQNRLLIGAVSHFTTFAIVSGCASLDADKAVVNQVDMSRRSFAQVCGTADNDGTCKTVTNWPKWTKAGTIAGLHETEYVDKIPVLLAPNPSPPAGQVPHTTECVLKDWSQDDQAKEAASQASIAGASGLCNTDAFKEDCVTQCSAASKKWFGVDNKFFSQDSLSDDKLMSCDSTVAQGVCTGITCSNYQKASPMTYGYEDKGQLKAGPDYTYAGGWGVLYFSIAKSGNACVAESGSKNDKGQEIAKLSIEVGSSSEGSASDYPYTVCADPASSASGIKSCEGFKTTDPTKVVKEVLFNPVLTPTGTTVSVGSVDNGLSPGQNGAYFRVENLDEDSKPDGCLWADMNLSVWGSGIAKNEPDTELDTNSEYQDYKNFGYTYGATGTSGFNGAYTGNWVNGVFPTLGATCAAIGTDPEASSSSTDCTAWEKSITPEQIVALIAEKAKVKWDELNAKPAFASQLPTVEEFQKIIIGIATQESSLRHCSASGKVITGDGGTSIGVMQAPDAPGVYRLGSNIDIGINHLVDKYTMVDCRDGYSLDCSSTCSKFNPTGVDCASEKKTYTGWQCALRGYNGWGCEYRGGTGSWVYCGPDCNGYVQKVTSYASQITTIPSCDSGTTPAPTPTNPTPTNPVTPNGNKIVDTAKKYLGCHYVYYPVSDTNLGNCKQSGKGYTCATYVFAVFQDACGLTLYGDGSQKCDNNAAVLTQLGNANPATLQPGDIFSYGPGVGHTGIFVGKDSNGQYIFIHDYPGTGVSYTTYAAIVAHPNLKFCRAKTC